MRYMYYALFLLWKGIMAHAILCHEKPDLGQIRQAACIICWWERKWKSRVRPSGYSASESPRHLWTLFFFSRYHFFSLVRSVTRWTYCWTWLGLFIIVHHSIRCSLTLDNVICIFFKKKLCKFFLQEYSTLCTTRGWNCSDKIGPDISDMIWA